jgi:hypothetical protein
MAKNPFLMPKPAGKPHKEPDADESGVKVPDNDSDDKLMPAIRKMLATRKRKARPIR